MSFGVNSPEPIQVNTLDMSDQEGISQELDFLLHSGAVFALESALKCSQRRNVEGLGGTPRSVFHDIHGREITL